MSVEDAVNRDASVLIHSDVTDKIIGAAVRVHHALGPGLLESVYETCLVHEFLSAGLAFQRQFALPIVYDGITLESGLRLDLLVEQVVVVELKAVEKLLPIHEAQLMTYLRLSKVKVGLLINFNELRLVDGIKRRVL